MEKGAPAFAFTSWYSYDVFVLIHLATRLSLLVLFLTDFGAFFGWPFAEVVCMLAGSEGAGLRREDCVNLAVVCEDFRLGARINID